MFFTNISILYNLRGLIKVPIAYILKYFIDELTHPNNSFLQISKAAFLIENFIHKNKCGKFFNHRLFPYSNWGGLYDNVYYIKHIFNRLALRCYMFNSGYKIPY